MPSVKNIKISVKTYLLKTWEAISNLLIALLDQIENNPNEIHIGDPMRGCSGLHVTTNQPAVTETLESEIDNNAGTGTNTLLSSRNYSSTVWLQPTCAGYLIG